MGKCGPFYLTASDKKVLHGLNLRLNTIAPIGFFAIGYGSCNLKMARNPIIDIVGEPWIVEE